MSRTVVGAVSILWMLVAAGCETVDEPGVAEMDDGEMARWHLSRDPGGPAWVGMTGPLRADDLVQEANHAMDQLQFARAEAMLDRAAVIDRHTGIAEFQNCSLHYHTYRFAEAEQYCTVAIEQRGAVAEYFEVLERGLVRVKLGKLDEAEQDFLWCKEMDPQCAEAYYDHSWVFAARGDVDATIAQIRLAGERDAVYTGLDHVRSDPPYERFEEDATWKAFLGELNKDAPVRVDDEWMEAVGVAGVPE